MMKKSSKWFTIISGALLLYSIINLFVIKIPTAINGVVLFAFYIPYIIVYIASVVKNKK